MKSERPASWYDRRGPALLLAIVALSMTYLLGSRALDTGSWQQYFLAFVLLIFSINRFTRTIKGNHHGKN